MKLKQVAAELSRRKEKSGLSLNNLTAGRSIDRSLLSRFLAGQIENPNLRTLVECVEAFGLQLVIVNSDGTQMRIEYCRD